MPQKINLREVKPQGQNPIQDYASFNRQDFSSLKNTASKLKGLAVFHINATSQGGGVAEMLQSQVWFEKSLGLDSHWLIIEAPPDFFTITKKMHNLLQGREGYLAEDEKTRYLSVNEELQKSLLRILKRTGRGIIIIHDPQPIPLVKFIPPDFKTVLRLHIDISTPNPSVVDFLKPMVLGYDKVVLSNSEYATAVPWLAKDKIKIVYPAIDPLTDKNRPMDPLAASVILEDLGIDPTKPLVSQVSRFDPWKDPVGVIRSYYLAKKEIPEIQLAMAGLILAKDDPEATIIFKQVKKHAQGDPDIFLFSDPREITEISNNQLVNALYTASSVVIQKSIREGFGMTITEAMLKGKAVVAGRTIGSVAQIKNGFNGILVSSPERAAAAIIKLLKNEELRSRLGKNAKRTASKNFLLPRLILDHLRLYLQLKK